jgi:hypothetical protein
MKVAGKPFLISKPEPPLNTTPVGVPVGLIFGFDGGIVTTSDAIAPVPE